MLRRALPVVLVLSALYAGCGVRVVVGAEAACERIVLALDHAAPRCHKTAVESDDCSGAILAGDPGSCEAEMAAPSCDKGASCWVKWGP